MKDNVAKNPYRNFWRLYLHSTNAVSGDWRDGTYFIDLPDALDVDNEYQVAVESFFVNNTVNVPYIISSSSIPQGNAYSTMTKGMTNNILANQSNYFYRYLDFRTVGCKLQDLTFLRGKLINIRISDIAGNLIATDAFGVSPAWVMTLVVYPVPKEN
jgi:hypothetical protein